MVIKQLITFLNSRVLWRNNLVFKKVVNFGKMERVTVRCAEGDEFLTMSFFYGKRQNNLLRPKTELLEKSLERIKNSVIKVEKKANNKRNKKAKIEHQSQAQRVETEDNIKCLLLQNGKEIDTTKQNQDVWVEGTILQIREINYPVCKNIPAITSLKLPTKLMVNCPVFPRIITEFAGNDDCSYIWYQGVQSLKQQSNQSNSNKTTEEAAESVPMETNQVVAAASKIKVIERKWEEVCRDRVYTPTETALGRTLKLECVPINGDRKGDSKEIVSSSEVTQGPVEFPFERRHKLTKERASEGCFRVVCYNILADMYADSDFSRDVLYPYCPAEFLDIDYREQIILKELAGFNSDIICLQEVGKKFFQQSLQPSLMGSKLNGLIQGKDKQVSEGEAVFYNNDKFRLVEEHNIILNQELKKPYNSDLLEGVSRSPAMLKRFHDLSTIGQVVVLEHIADPSHKLCIANTHLYFHPRAGHLRLLQTAIILRHLETLQKFYQENKQGNLCFLICGDLNSKPMSAVYKYLVNRSIPSNTVDWYTSGKEEFCGGISLSHTLDLTDACKDVEYTNFVAGFHGKLDHVLIQSSRLELETMIPLSSHEEVTKHVALPNEVFPSDHLPLVCDIRWKN